MLLKFFSGAGEKNTRVSLSIFVEFDFRSKRSHLTSSVKNRRKSCLFCAEMALNKIKNLINELKRRNAMPTLELIENLAERRLLEPIRVAQTLKMLVSEEAD